MMSGVSVACRLLPVLSRQIEQLAMQDATFRDLCDDLAAAEATLLDLRQLPKSISKQRLAECEGWITSLSEEIETALKRAGTVMRARQADL
ncbi:MAG: hypothetical protein ABWY13_08025 [Mesorhizobium sp.]